MSGVGISELEIKRVIKESGDYYLKRNFVVVFQPNHIKSFIDICRIKANHRQNDLFLILNTNRSNEPVTY